GGIRMTDKERLEEIKEEVESLRGDMYVHSIETETSADIILDDMEWLIERVQELEDIIRVQELEDIIYQDARQGMIEDLYEENKRYRETIKPVRSEIEYALYSNKSEDVKRHYLQNAEREATEALEGEGE